MGNALYAQATGVILLFAFLFFIVMAAKGWRWHHVTTLVLIFFSAMFFVFLAACVLKTHQTWRTRHQQLAKELEQEQKTGEELRGGPLDLTAESADSILRLENELQRIIGDRGRVWREVQFNGAQGTQISLKFPERNVTGVDNPPPLHRLQPKTVLYAFKEIENPDGWKVPGLYMGEWVVQSVAADSVVVAPAQAATIDQIQQGQIPGGGTWALYEVMPNDAQYKFAHLDDTQVREMLMPGGWHTRPPMAPQELYEAMVKEYLRDATPLIAAIQQGVEAEAELAAIRDGLLDGGQATPDDPPDQRWRVVQLKQPWKIKVDTEQPASQFSPRHFEPATGLALTPALRHDDPATPEVEEAEFDVGDKLVLDEQAAQALIDQGIADGLETLYRRPLRDYAFAFDAIFRHLLILNDDIRLITKANATLQDSIDKANKQVAYRTEEKGKLGEDLVFVNKELDAMKQYLSTLQTQYNAVRGDLYRCYSENLQLVDNIRRIEQAIIAAIQQQLAAARE